jgi:predicted dienelactone hydrolase
MPRLLAATVCLSLATSLSAQAPAGPRFPAELFEKPGGPYAVGTRDYHWIDQSRGETFTKDPADKRHVLVRVWYPASGPAAGADKAAWILNLEEYKSGPDYNQFKQVAHVKTNSVLDAPVLDGKWPVLIYNHGGGWTRWSGTFTTEMLASHGYVVFAIDHAGFNKTTDFPDGTKFAIDTLGPPKQTGNMMQDAPAFFAWLGEQTFPVWVADSRFVLDQAEGLGRSPGPFKDKLDFSKVGALGWSFGGATAVELTHADPRVKVGVDQDGQLFGGVVEKGSTRAVMLMHNTDDPTASVPDSVKPAMAKLVEETRAISARTKAKSTGPWTEVRIDRTNHGHFSDLTLIYKPDTTKLLSARRAHEIINAYTLAFFDRHLRGKQDVVMPTFPEAKVEERP